MGRLLPVLALGGWALLDPVAIAAPVAGGVGLVLLLGGAVVRLHVYLR